MKFKISNTVVDIRFSFILIIAFAIIFELDSLIYVLIFSILHEAGHILALYFQHKNADKIIVSFNGFGLVHSCEFTFLQNLYFLSSGVIVNLIFVLLGVCREINLALLVLNSLPIYPLDGGRLLKLILNKYLPLTISDNLFKFVSALFLIAVLIYSVCYKNFNLFLIVLYSVVYSVNNSFD